MRSRFAGYSVYKRRRQRGSLAVYLMIATLAVIGGAGYLASGKPADTKPTEKTVESGAPSVPTVNLRPNLDQTLELRDVSGGATKARFSRKMTDGKSSFAVIGELKKLAAGYYYEVWAVQPDPYKFMSLGKMVERTDGKFGLVFEGNEDLRGYSDIIITLEKNDRDPAPSTHVMEGKF